KTLRLGPASDLMVGEEVIAIGNPFGYENSVSKGIISAVGREIEMPGGVTLSNLIQTTASINPGNSGGPLLNINGERIGINVALRQEAQGLAFALNAATVQEVLSRRLSASRRTGYYHGLDVREKVDEDGEERSRVVVHDVAENTPAAAAGLKEGDQIVRLGSLSVGNRFDVERALWDTHVGEKVTVTVVRSGRRLNVEMPLTSSQAIASREAALQGPPGSDLQGRCRHKVTAGALLLFRGRRDNIRKRALRSGIPSAPVRVSWDCFSRTRPTARLPEGPPSPEPRG